MSLVPFLTSAVEMEPASAALKGYIGGTGGSGGLSPQYAPFLHGGNLYTVLEAAGPIPGSFTPSGGIFVYQSVNQGVTWASLDTANGPTRTDMTPVAGFFFDGDHTIIVAWIPDGGPLVGHTGAINLKNFDLNTGTWGATYATSGAPLVWQVGQCYKRPDGSILVFGSPNRVAGNVQGETAYVFSGGAWSSFACDTNLGAGFAATGNVASVMDSTGNIHLFMIAKDGPPVTTAHLAYQLVLTTNTLGVSAVVQSGVVNLPGRAEYQPGISGDNVIIGIVDATNSFPTVAVGTPLAAPVFTTLGAPGIDPNLPAGITTLFCPVITADATGIYASYILQTLITTFIRTCLNTNITTPLVGWTQSIQAFDASGSAGDASGWQFLGIARDTGNLFASANTTVGGIGQPTQFWLGVFSPPAPVALPSLGSQGGGGIPVLGCQCCPVVKTPFKIRKRKTEFDAPPPGSSHVNVRGTALGPATITPLIICQYQVPNNRRFQLDGLVAIATLIAGWTPGDGNVIFSVTIDRTIGGTQAQGVAFKDYGKVTVPLGSLQTPWQIPRSDRVIAQSRDIVRLTVQTDPTVIGIGTLTRFVGLLQGYEWGI